MSDEVTGSEEPTADPVEGAGTDAAEGGTPPGAEETTETVEAEASFSLDEGWEAMDDAALQTLFSELDEAIAAAKLVEPTALTFQAVADAKARREAQGAIAAELEKRKGDRETLAKEMASLDTDAPALPDMTIEAPAAVDEKPAAEKPAAKAASAASVMVAASVPAAPAPAQPAAAKRSPSKMAALEATQPRWMSTREVGEQASWGNLINSTKPVPGGNAGIEPRPHESVLAAARVDGYSEGATLTDSASHNERVLARLTDDHRERRMDEARGGAKMAAICDPATIIRDAMVCGTDATPFQASLPQAGAVSGNALKFQYRQPTSIDEATDGVGEWDADDQASVDLDDSATWKPCVAIACPGYATETATEITGCYTIDAFTELSSPEAEADFAQAKDRAFARFSEAWYLRKVDTYLHHLSFNGYVGALPSLIESILTATVIGDYGERLTPGSFAVYGSPGVIAAATIDANKRAYGGDAVQAMADVQQAVEGATGTSYLQLLDLPLTSGGALQASPFGDVGTVGDEDATVLPTLDTVSFQLRVLDPSAFVQFTTGEAIFGEQITHAQARRNERGFFQRIFGGMMKPGCAPGYLIDITLCTDGSRGGFVAPGCPPSGFDSEGGGFVATPEG